ncbi:hypothetical protein Fmac_024182 [Flemingia macrophylla]|uniref:ADP-ribosyl cyclase/cyclic ADP-ribose hydrolase n=1 Tax=Flemingia macrophylla TaxID=520843 RepID=A0ABD1LNM3_9FABA
MNSNSNLQASQRRSGTAKHKMASWSPRKYDVFISFRGEDVRHSFVSHLRPALHRDSIEVFVDDNLHKGDEVWPTLCQAIHASHLAIVVFSQNYAESKWCMKELVEILHCRKTQGLVVIPVFYEVDPSHVRKHSGTYGQAIAEHETCFGDKDKQSIQDWKAALTEAANICGWVSRSRDYKNESHVIEKIVEDVFEKLSLRSPVQLKVQHLVEIEKHCDELKQLMSKYQKHQLQENVQVIGIWGMGGLGKTTIAKALFSQIFPQYDVVCFLANVREESKRHGLDSLCDKLLFELLKVQHKNNPAGSTFIMKRLKNKKVLIVLDDVDSSDQLDELSREVLIHADPGSKLIITTRDMHLLRGKAHEIYEVKIWNFAKSLELFCLHAFKDRLPKKGYEDLSERAVKYAGGVPLALKVLGSNLYCRDTEYWDCELNKLMKCPNERIQNVLQVSYDGLDYLQKNVFLDIAFFFKGEDKDSVIRILDACGFCATSGVKVLEDKALITISYSGTIQIHDLIQEMGLNIVRGGCKDPNKRSRLREIEEVSAVLENKTGSDIVEGIKLDLSQIEDVHLNADTFHMMTSLRFLRLYVPSGKKSGNVHHFGVLSKLSAKLRYLEWNGCFLKSLPETFFAKMLVEIRMPRSHVIELWQGVQDVANLVRIDLSECKHLKNLPDLSKATGLKWVNLSGCESLLAIHPSVFSSDTLETLILDGCKKLKSLKSEKHLTSLEKISVNGCTSLREFSVTSDSITSLDISSTGIQKLDTSLFWYLKHLKSLNVHGLRHAPAGLFNLEDLVELRICNSKLEISNFMLFCLFESSKFLQLLHLKDCCNLCGSLDRIISGSFLYEIRLDGSSVKTLPDGIMSLEYLRTLTLEDCRKLRSVPFHPEPIMWECPTYRRLRKTISSDAMIMANRKFISFKNCVALDEPSVHRIVRKFKYLSERVASKNISEKRYGANTKIYNYNFVKVCFPGSRVPEVFKYRTTDSTITIDLPSLRSDIMGLSLCAVLPHSRVLKNLGAKIWCQCYLEDGTKLGAATTWYDEAVSGLISDHVFIWHDSSHFDNIVEIYRTGHERRVSFEIYVTNGMGERVTIATRECGICLISGQDRPLLNPLNFGVIEHDATATATATWYFSEQCSCSRDCLVGVLRYLWRLISCVFKIFCCCNKDRQESRSQNEVNEQLLLESDDFHDHLV